MPEVTYFPAESRELRVYFAQPITRAAPAVVVIQDSLALSLWGRAQRLEMALTELGIDHDVKEYPAARQLHEPDQRGARLRALAHVCRLRPSSLLG